LAEPSIWNWLIRFYAYIKPKEGQHGITFVYDIRLETLPPQIQKEKIAEIKSFNMPVWLDLLASDELYRLMFGKKKSIVKRLYWPSATRLISLAANEKPRYAKTPANIHIVKVRTADEFAFWAKIAMGYSAASYPDMHPVFHYLYVKMG
jgi:hypothetical protein